MVTIADVFLTLERFLGKMKKISVLLLFITLALFSAQARQAAIHPAFKSGEQLRYTVSYSASMWPNTDMGDLTISVSDEMLNGVPALKISARATVKGMFAWFYNLDDRYYTWLSKKDYKPLKSSSELQEGEYRYSSQFIYDWDRRVSQNTYRNHKVNTPSESVISLEKDAMDGIALFFNLRLHDADEYTQGKYMLLPLLLKDKVQLVKYKYYGRETISVKGLGKVKTLKFSCQLINDDAATFEDGSEFFIWISDDGNKVPVYIESPLKVGRVMARLTSYKNLMHTAGSVLK